MAIPDPTVSVRIPPKLLERLDAIAEYHNHSRSYVMLLAMAALALPNGEAHRKFNALRDRYDRSRRRQRRW